jgi:hypothetical protein
MWMFWAFKFSFVVDILVILVATFPKIGRNFIQFSGHTGWKIQSVLQSLDVYRLSS